MTVYTNDPARTGLADGTAVTVANSGGGANTAFNQVNGTVTMSTGHHSSVDAASYHIAASSGAKTSVRLPIASPAASNALRFPVEFGTPVAPSAAQILVQLDSTGQNYIGVNSAGKMIVTLQGANAHTASSAVTAGQYWLEVWWEIAASGADFHYKLYPDDGVYTAVDSYDTTTGNTGTTNPTVVYLGKQTNSGSWCDLWIGTIAYSAGGTAFLGLPAANTAPTANAGPDQTNVPAAATVTLDGTGSTDPDGDPLTYAWTQTAGTAVTLSDATAAQPTFTAPPTSTSQTCTFSLVVSDNHGHSSTADTVDIGIVAAITQDIHIPTSPLDVVIAHATHANNITCGKPANTDNGDLLIACMLEHDPSDTITPPSGWTSWGAGNTASPLGTSQIYYKKIPNAGAETATSYTFSWAGGSTRATLVIFRVVGSDATSPKDSNGSFSSLAGTSTITVPADTTVGSRVMAIAWTAANRTDTTHPLLASPSAAWQTIALDDYDDGTASTGIWIGCQLRTAAGSTGTVAVPVSPAATGGSGGVMIGVLGAAVQVCDAGPDQTGLEPYSTAQLDGSGSVPRSGHTLTYAWSQTSGTPVTLSSPTAQKPTFTVPATWDGDDLIFQLVVNDGGGNSLPDTMTATILPHTIWRLDAGGKTPVQMKTL